jgi:hypothetical protein
MPERIDNESRQRELIAVDVNFLGQRYKTSNGLYTFPAPTLFTLEKNLFYLLRNSKEVEFDRKYLQRPDYLSFDEYGTVALAQMLMYVNSVFTPEDFDLQTVVIPQYAAVVEIIKDKFSKQDVSDLTGVDW